MDFGVKIQKLRKNKGLSQEKLATILNINRNYLSRIETGKSEPTLSVIRNIALYFNVESDSLMDIHYEKKTREEKIRKIHEECISLTDSDLNFIIRTLSVMRAEYVKEHRD